MPDLTFAEVGQILRLLESIDASEVDLEWGDLRLRVRHGDPAVSDQASASPQAATAHASHEPDASVTESEAPTTAEPQAKARVDSPAEVPDHWVAIKAPMVGTFYRSPKPGDPAFVDAGDVVSDLATPSGSSR